MLEKLFLGAVLLFFILAFAVKNVKTYLSTKKSIKGKSLKLSMSILISSLIYILILLRLSILSPEHIWEVEVMATQPLKYFGMLLVSIGFLLGILALIAMRNSWRVGIRYDQKTELVSRGIYRYSRNPYFLSYNILILGYILIFPSLLLMILLISLAVVFHFMILEEENYLLSVHGEEYINYKRRVGRYISLK